MCRDAIDLTKTRLMIARLRDLFERSLLSLDPEARVTQDREAKPYGLSHAVEFNQGSILERAGVALSQVRASSLPKAALPGRSDCEGCPFEANGVSVIVHPKHPFVPTVHANFRCIVVDMPDGTVKGWFGGGMDLTPYYPVLEDSQFWHQSIRDCFKDPAYAAFYPRFRQACDDYFYLPHRQEPRGVGGIFFDDWSEGSYCDLQDFVEQLGQCFIQSYVALCHRRMHEAYEPHHRAFQAFRRGRYVEFNLLYDRGTRFGLEFGGKVEPIFLSMPPMVTWEYGVPEALKVDQLQWFRHCEQIKTWLNERQVV